MYIVRETINQIQVLNVDIFDVPDTEKQNEPIWCWWCSEFEC